MNVNLPVADAAGNIGLARARLPFGTLLELELSVAQAESCAEITWAPKLVSSNQNPAVSSSEWRFPITYPYYSGPLASSLRYCNLACSVT